MAGYSRLMAADEEGTLAHLKAHRRELFDPKIAEHRGRIVKTTGDGILIEFASAVDAVRCAVEIQKGMTERNSNVPQDRRIEFRMGVNVGDVISEDGDIFGDGVNVAARLENVAEPNGIILSEEDAYRQVRDRLDVVFEDRGDQQLKNIARPVRVYRVQHDRLSRPTSLTLTLPDKPSIAVLPFQNMSGDPDQEYFADGMVEDIITALSRFRQLFVIARNSSFVYKGRAVDVKQVGRELGVRYVLEGSVRRSGKRIRITGQLVDTATGAHLWANRFDGALEDVFELQDQVTASVTGAIAPKIEQAEIERAKRKPPENLDAYDYYLRALESHYRTTREATDEVLRLCHKAIKLDPDFAPAYGLAALCYVPRRANSWMDDPATETAEALRLAQRTIELGREDAVALCGAAMTFSIVVGDLSNAVVAVDRALSVNANLATAWLVSASIRARLGKSELAIEHAEQALRLSPLDPYRFVIYGAMGAAHFFAGRYEEASVWSEKSISERPNDYMVGRRFLAASYALAGHVEQARQAGAILQVHVPTARVSDLKDWITLRRPQDIAKLKEGLRKAGLPE